MKQVSEFFRDQANRQEVHFINKEITNDPGFVIKLNQRQVRVKTKTFGTNTKQKIVALHSNGSRSWKSVKSRS